MVISIKYDCTFNDTVCLFYVNYISKVIYLNIIKYVTF